MVGFRLATCGKTDHDTAERGAFNTETTPRSCKHMWEKNQNRGSSGGNEPDTKGAGRECSIFSTLKGYSRGRGGLKCGRTKGMHTKERGGGGGGVGVYGLGVGSGVGGAQALGG